MVPLPDIADERNFWEPCPFANILNITNIDVSKFNSRDSNSVRESPRTILMHSKCTTSVPGYCFDVVQQKYVFS